MKITQSLLDNLTEQAKASPCLRFNLGFRICPSDQSQLMLNAIEPESELPVHRHGFSSDTVMVLRGHLREDGVNYLTGMSLTAEYRRLIHGGAV